MDSQIRRNVYRRVLLFLLTTFLLTACINLPPDPSAGKMQVVEVGDQVYLDGSGSYDINGDKLKFSWSIESKPESSETEIEAALTTDAHFLADEEGQFVIKLSVSDGKYVVADYVTIIVNAGSGTSSEDSIDTGHIAGSVSFDHLGITENCGNCHNGTVAVGKLVNHIVTTEKCNECHSTQEWYPVITVAHTETFGDCISCHNNTIAFGKISTHLNTSDNCAACHSVHIWSPAITVDHMEIIGACEYCHDGIIASGKPLEHIATDNDASCNDCHSTDIWKISNG